MFLIDTSRNGQPVYDPIVNQSLDNYLINDLKLKGHGLIMYINDPAVIVGVNQNIFAEVNVPYLLENNIKLVRRTAAVEQFTTIVATWCLKTSLLGILRMALNGAITVCLLNQFLMLFTKWVPPKQRYVGRVTWLLIITNSPG